MTPAGDRAAVTAPPRSDIALIAVAIGGVSTSGVLIAATAAPALAIACWRNALATAVLAPLVLARHRAEVRGLARRDAALLGLAGLLLAAHFAAWVPAVTMTSVASATTLVATQPVWSALIARAQGAHVPRGVWLGIALAVAGVGIVAGVDVTVSSRALAGDLLAVLGGALAAGYVAVGGTARRTVSTTVYTCACYATAAAALAVACVLAGVAMWGYAGGAWWRIAALTVFAQLLGHSLLNRVLRTTSPTVVSLAILFEAPGAALLAAVFLGQHPRPAALPGLVLLLAGLAVVIRAARPRNAALAVPVE